MSTGDFTEVPRTNRAIPNEKFISKFLARYTDPCVTTEIGVPVNETLPSFLRAVGDYDRQVLESAFAPIGEDDGSNPLIKCVEEEFQGRKSRLYIKTKDKEPMIIDVKLSFADEPFVRLAKPVSYDSKASETVFYLGCESLRGDDPIESHLRWFTLDATLPNNVTIIAAEVYAKPTGVSFSKLATESGRSKWIVDDRVAVLTPRRLGKNRFELFTNATRELLIDRNSVLVLRVTIEG